MKISNLKFTITDKTKSLIACEFNWKGLFEVNMRYDYFDAYYKKEMKVDITKEFETRAEAKKYITENTPTTEQAAGDMSYGYLQQYDCEIRDVKGENGKFYDTATVAKEVSK